MKRPNRRTSSRALERPSLLFRIPGLQQGLARLFQELQTARTRARFIASPAKVITRLLPGVRLSPTEVSDANRLLFSVLANDRFRKWATSYQKRYERMSRVNPNLKLDRSRVMQDLAEAIAKFGDKNILIGLIGTGFAPPVAKPPKSVAVSNYIHTTTVLLVGGYAVIFVVLTVIDLTPYTDRQPGPRFALSPADIRAVADQLVVRAKQLSRSGDLSNTDAKVG